MQEADERVQKDGEDFNICVYISYFNLKQLGGARGLDVGEGVDDDGEDDVEHDERRDEHPAPEEDLVQNRCKPGVNQV